MGEALPACWPDGALAAPVIEADVSQTGSIVLQIDVPTDCPWLEGHFPEQAVLPGVILLRWALQLIATSWPELAAVAVVSNLKFQQPVLPPAQLTLELHRHRELPRIDFAWALGDAPCARGRASFA